MLTFPEVLTHEDGVVVFPDDEDPNLFYLLPGRPRLRFEGNRPVFRGLFWTDDASGAQPSVAGMRGAMLNFDVNLAVPPALRQDVEKKIRDTGVQQARHEALLRDERERLERLARARGEGAPTTPPRVPDVGPIRFGSVQFLSGNVVLLERQGGGFVEWSSAGGPPSLIGDNNAAFALRLGPEGAAVWYRALEQDATAIGIRYELKFQARLPSLQIHVWAGSRQSLEIERKAQRVIENMDQGCEDADVERINVTEITEKLVEEGLVNVEIVKGSAKISDEHVSQLRNAALSLITDRVKEVIQHRIRGMTEEERRSSLLQKVTEEVTGFAELRLTQKDVIEWGVNPQATITDFLGGLGGAERHRLVTLVDLADPVVATLEVPVTVSAPWDASPPVTSVVVRVEYPAGGADARKEFSLDRTRTQETFRWRRARRDRGTVSYSAKAFLQGVAEPIVLPGGQTNGAVHIEVPRLGAFSVRARPHPSMFTLKGAGAISGVELRYAYKADGARDRVEGSAMLRPTDAEGVEIKHTTFREIDAPLRVRPVYFRDGAPAIEGAERQVWMKAGQEMPLTVELPWPDVLQLGARVAPGIPGLEKVSVDLRHRDEASDFESGGRIVLEKDGDWEGRTSLVQVNRANQRFSYRYAVQGKDQLTLGPWVDAEGDQELLLPVLAVRLHLDRLELGTAFTEAILRLAYADPGRRFQTQQQLFLTKESTDVVWLVPRVDPTLDRYRYGLTLFPPAGDPVEVPETDGRGPDLILRPPA